jgi:hypothetical protein
MIGFLDEGDRELRNLTYRMLVDLGRAPTTGETAAAAGMKESAVSDAWQRLHDAHALVLDTDGELRMLAPFSAVETRFRVEAAGRWWHANCAWDAFGICAALQTDGHIVTTCADCDAPIEVAVYDDEPDDESLWFHCLVPARHWWDDIVFT